MTGKRKLDLEKALEYGRPALEKLKQTTPPKVEKLVTKMELLQKFRAEIAQLYKDGYTLEQIAEALSKTGEYQIFPSTLKSALSKRRSKKPVSQKTLRPQIRPEQILDIGEEGYQYLGKQCIQRIAVKIRSLSLFFKNLYY